jgi:DNA polymerase sigma
MIKKAKNETMLQTQLGKIIREIGNILSKKSKYFINLIEYLLKGNLDRMTNVNILTHTRVPIVKFYDPVT